MDGNLRVFLSYIKSLSHLHSMSSNPNLSEYEQIRAANIARNEHFLEDIGLTGITGETRRRGEGIGGEGKKKQRNTVPVFIDESSLILRRSSRVAAISIDPISYDDVDDDDEHTRCEQDSGDNSCVAE